MILYANIGTLDLDKSKSGPTKFPMITMATSEEIREFKSLLVSASTKGFKIKNRKLCFTLGCSEGILYSDFYTSLEHLPEVNNEIWSVLENIPAWNPFQEAKRTLENYLVLWDFVPAEDQESLSSEDMMDQAQNQTRDQREIQVK